MIPCRNIALLPVLALLLFAGCNILTGTEKQNMNQNNEIYQVRVTIGSSARTIFPDLAAGFSKFEISAEPAAGNTQNPPAPVTINNGTQKTISLPLGDWNIIVTGYVTAAGTDYPAVTGSAPLKVTGSSHSVNVLVNMPETGGTGTFAYTVNFPAGGSAHVRLEPWPIGETPVVDAAVAASGTPVTQSVPSGIYFLTVTASVNAATSYTRNEIVHIYPYLTSSASHKFNDPNEMGIDTLVSRGKNTAASTSGGTAPQLVDGEYHLYSWPGNWRAGTGDWVSIDVGDTGMTELILLWTSSNNYFHLITENGTPTSYRIHTSANSSNGNPNNGTWNEVAAVTGNEYKVRTHAIPFTGQRWVRFTIDGVHGGSDTTMIDEIELHDNSDGKVDGWLFFGDSITAEAFDRNGQPNEHRRIPAFSDLVWDDGKGTHRPMQINAGYAGDTARPDPGLPKTSLQRLTETLEQNDGIRVVAICLGTNDCYNSPINIQNFYQGMKSLIEYAHSKGKIVIVPTLPWRCDDPVWRPESIQEEFNRIIIEDLKEDYSYLLMGPNLYDNFYDHRDLLRGEAYDPPDWLHPNLNGCKYINELWAKTAESVPRP